MSSDSSDPSDPPDRQPPHVDRAVLRALDRGRRRLAREGYLPSVDPTEPGTLLRVDHAFAEAHGVPRPALLAVLDRDARGVLLAPFTVDGPLLAGDVVIPPEESPFGSGRTGRIVLHRWCPVRASAVAVRALHAGARCPAIAALPAVSMLLVPPPGKEGWVAAWRRLVASL